MHFLTATEWNKNNEFGAGICVSLLFSDVFMFAKKDHNSLGVKTDRICLLTILNAVVKKGIHLNGWISILGIVYERIIIIYTSNEICIKINGQQHGIKCLNLGECSNEPFKIRNWGRKSFCHQSLKFYICLTSLN